ncbi:BTAD domain-containing putative transcriptional regulator [Jatrophihabitans sp. DSM 45814]
MQVSVLGPVQVIDSGRVVQVAGLRLRRLLVRLAVDAEHPVSTSELIDAVWGEQTPAEEANALQTLISRLRRTLGNPQLVQQVPGGYQLAGVELDTDLFIQLVRDARLAAEAHDPARAAEVFRQALAVWRGPALSDAGDADYARFAVVRWNDLRLSAICGRIEADLKLGRAGDVVPELELLAQEHPLREQFTQLLMAALSASGRPAEALAVYERLRSRLADELGSDPTASLQQAHLELLRATPGPASSNGRSPAPGSAVEPRTARKTNLRSSLTSFLGRDDEVKRVSTLLESGRLATIVGPGGAGKTRLAGVVAADWTQRLDDGVWLVELAPVTEVANIPQAILGSLGVRTNQVLERATDVARMATLDRLIDVLADSSCLLVIDNCEHLISAVAQLLDNLLAHCPQLRVLTTSREPLGIDGEALCILPPLTLPTADASVLEATSYPSVQLFADRAASVSGDFAVDESTVSSVVEIVRRLDGLPLAIELAAARLRVLPVAEIAARLSDRFRLLTGGSRVAMPRHRTLRAVVEWSWDLLTPTERLLAERLSVFPSGATVDSAIAICADAALPADQIADLLNALVDKSLVQVDDTTGIRFRMLETIREYGAERLSERDAVDAVRMAHARYFAALVAEAEPWLRTAEQLTWLRILDLERDNALAALRYLGESGKREETLRLATSLGWYWTLLGSHSEAVTWLAFALDVPADSEGESDGAVEVLAAAVHALNTMATTFGDGAEPEVAATLTRLDEIGHRLAEIDADDNPVVMLMRPMMAFFSGDSERVMSLLEPAMSCGDAWVHGAALMFRSNLHENNGDIEAMRHDASLALEIFSEIGDRWGLASTLSALAQVHALDGELRLAIDEYQQAAAQLAEFGASSDEAMLHLRLTDLYLRLGDLEAAKRQAELVKTTDFQAGSRAQRLLADAAFAAIAVVENDQASIEYYRESLVDQLDLLSPVHPINGHIRAITLATVASLELCSHGPDQEARAARARDRLELAYDAALGTQDMPIMASVAVAVATWAADQGYDRESAAMLGAAAQLRGADDKTDTFVRSLTQRLRQSMADDFGEFYQQGRQLDREAALERVNPASIARAVSPS